MGFTTIDQQIADLFNKNFNLGGTWNWGNFLLCVSSLVLCIIFCGIIGFERERKGRSAGFRTHLLVGLGSCLIMIISIYGFPLAFTKSESDGMLYRDAARLAAAVITGVGFLGAGTIIHKQGGIKGLTTASTIWIVMAIGMACGSMNFILALTVTLTTIVVLICFRKVETNLRKKSQAIELVASGECPILTKILEVANKMNYTITEYNSSLVGTQALYIDIYFRVSSQKGAELDIIKFLEEIEKIDGVKNIQLSNQH